MKKLLLPVFSLCFAVLTSAQTPTMDFETWTGNDPQGWVSGNAIMLLGNPQSVFKETTPANVHGGTSSMKIVTVTLTNNPDPTTIANPMGVAFPGVVNMSPLGLKDGYQYTNRPNTMEFWYKYTPVGGDSASCFVMLSKWNGTSRDTVAVGGLIMMSASSYTQGVVSLIYNPAFANTIPDSMRLYFTATCYTTLTCGTAGSTLWVDDITYTGYNGINDNNLSSEGVTVYPNPATDRAVISVDAAEAHSVLLYDVAGKLIGSTLLNTPAGSSNKKTGTLTTSSFPAGLYSFTVTDKNGKALKSGKLNIIK